MSVEAFYAAIGGNFEGMMARMRSRERVLRFVRRFPMDGSFALLESSLEKGEEREAFRAAHTLKGVCQNLGFDRLYRVSAELTEALRPGAMRMENVPELMEKTREGYRQVVEAIALMED
ncbi:MAG: Hpt domain-containing protein [Clostridia bacterium]|nr:Hpt domain-containing protein [Clostridia bacterium]